MTKAKSNKAKLKPELLEKLSNHTKLNKESVRVELWRLVQKYPQLTPNAAGQLFALKRGFTVLKYLEPVDRQALGNIEIKKIEIPVKRRSRKNEMIIKFAVYETDDHLLGKHIDQINRTYTCKCYTATFILCRKVLENLIVTLLKKKYPEKIEEHRAKYFDLKKSRNLDFNVLLKNLRNSAVDFMPENKLVERICQLADGFKEDANEMTHSLYHIASKKEIDEKEFQSILDLIKRLEKYLEKLN